MQPCRSPARTRPGRPSAHPPQAQTAQSYATAASILERGAFQAAEAAASGTPSAPGATLDPGVSALVAFMRQPEELKKGGSAAVTGALGAAGAAGGALPAAVGDGEERKGKVQMAPEGASGRRAIAACRFLCAAAVTSAPYEQKSC